MTLTQYYCFNPDCPGSIFHEETCVSKTIAGDEPMADCLCDRCGQELLSAPLLAWRLELSKALTFSQLPFKAAEPAETLVH